MDDVASALGKAARDLFQAGILWQAIWPMLAAFVFWGYVAVAVWAHGVMVITGLLPDFAWAAWAWAAHWIAGFLLLVAFGGVVYFTALFLVAVVALPRIIEIIARRDYPDLTRHGEHPLRGGITNTLNAGGLFVLGWLVCLPLLLVPGAVLVLPLCWAAWLNQRTFRFDALVEFATRNELHTLVKNNRPTLYIAGFATAATAYLPLLHFLTPAYTALVYVHLCLGKLRVLRQAQGVGL